MFYQFYIFCKVLKDRIYQEFIDYYDNDSIVNLSNNNQIYSYFNKFLEYYDDFILFSYLNK